MNPLRQFKRFLIYKIKKKINIDLKEDQKNLSIDELLQFYKSDKADKWENNLGHGFSKYYEKYFENLKSKEIKILEIGSFSGGSAASFVKFLPLSEVYSLDINITNFKYYSKKIKVYGLDISKELMVKKFYKKINILPETKFFDIIIDDGSHKLSDILFSLNSFYKNLKKNGFYVIEDFMFPNYFEHLNDVDELKIDELAERIRNKKKFNSNIIEDKLKNYFKNKNNIVNVYKGNLSNSDIVFFQKN